MPDTQIKDGWLIRPSFLSKNGQDRHTPCLLLAYNAPRMVDELAEAVGCAVLRIPPWERLPAPVSAHPDLLAFPLHREGEPPSLLLPEDYYKANADFWARTGIPIRLTDHPFDDRYPADIGLDPLVMDGRLYGRLDAVAAELLAAYPQQTGVRQGYARCSVVPLTEQAAITADRPLADALRAHSIDVLLIRAGHILLDGYGYGFIGGASFPLPDGSIGFFGDLSTHPDHAAIEAFADRHGVRLRSLPGALADFGGGILIE